MRAAMTVTKTEETRMRELLRRDWERETRTQFSGRLSNVQSREAVGVLDPGTCAAAQPRSSRHQGLRRARAGEIPPRIERVLQARSLRFSRR